LYSYWLGAGAHANLWVRKWLPAQKQITVTRMHGSDLYEHAHSSNYLPFRQFLLERVDAVYAISANGARYALEHWRCPAEKLRVSELGTEDHFEGRFPTPQTPFTVLSCSYISPLKRIAMIAEAVSRLRGAKVHWIHVGGGEGEAMLRADCQARFAGQSRLTYELLGSVPHERVIAMLRDRNINVLVNASSSEGIPVSMMEAQCSGIPVIGPNVGGIAEIINPERNGLLLEEPLSAASLARAMQSLIDMQPARYQAMCRLSRFAWESKFSAAINYPRFTGSVSDLVGGL